jgi:hypothetical protein
MVHCIPTLKGAERSCEISSTMITKKKSIQKMLARSFFGVVGGVFGMDGCFGLMVCCF